MSKHMGIAAGFTFTIAAGGANICLVTIQVVDNEGNAIEEVFVFPVWLSGAKSGAGVTGLADSVNVQSGGSGIDLNALIATDAALAQTSALGAYTLEITDTGKAAGYVGAQIPTGPNAGRCQTSRVLATADYG